MSLIRKISSFGDGGSVALLHSAVLTTLRSPARHHPSRSKGYFKKVDCQRPVYVHEEASPETWYRLSRIFSCSWTRWEDPSPIVVQVLHVGKCSDSLRRLLLMFHPSIVPFNLHHVVNMSTLASSWYPSSSFLPHSAFCHTVHIWDNEKVTCYSLFQELNIPETCSNLYV